MTTRRAALLVALVLGVFAGIRPAQAQGLDPVSKDALAATIRTLQSPGEHGGGARPSLDPRIRSLGDSPESTREMNDLAAEIFTEIAERSGGDPDKMSELLARGKSDPAAFAASLSPATREKL